MGVENSVDQEQRCWASKMLTKHLHPAQKGGKRITTLGCVDWTRLTREDMVMP